MVKKTPNSSKEDRIIDLLERIGALALYLYVGMNHHVIAKRLGMGTQRVTALLRGLKKIKDNKKK